MKPPVPNRLPLRCAGLCIVPLLLLAGLQPATAGIITLQDLSPGVGCATPPDPDTPGNEFGFPAGCWTLQNLNADGTSGGYATGNYFSGPGYIGVNGSDANILNDDQISYSGPMVDSFGGAIGTFTQFTTVITQDTPGVTYDEATLTWSGDFTFNWLFTTQDAGSFYDPAGYLLCPAAPGGFPSNQCGTYQLTADVDAFFPQDPLNPPSSPFAESGQTTVTLAPGDAFGLYVLTLDNANGAGTIVLSDVATPTPEPASLLMIGCGLIAIGIRRKSRRKE
jgi:hypothetical protein